MRVPVLKKAKSERTQINTFGGYCNRETLKENVFSDMKNLTGNGYPGISSREMRGLLETGDEKIYGINSLDICRDGRLIKNALVLETDRRLKAYYEEDGGLVSRELFNTGTVLSKGEKNCVVSGSKLYYFPDNISYDLMSGDITVLGYSTEYKLGASEEDGYFYEISFEPCDIEGNDADESSYFRRIKRSIYNNDPSSVGKGSFYGCMTFSTSIEVGDCVKLSGFNDAKMNGYYNIKGKVHNNEYLIVESTNTCIQSSGSVFLKREIPKMDYVISCNNRLWGCRYGTDNEGRFVNEIYASALGDGRNWHKFLGISTDSWSASVGCSGAFTGAVCMDSYPVFFKEDTIIKIFGDYPSEFCFTENRQMGIEKGSAKSAVFVNDDLYYKSYSGIVRYDGGIPVNVDRDLGDAKYKNAIAGTVGDRYFVSMENEEGVRALLVYDTYRRLWHKEDNLNIKAFCRCGGDLYFLSEDEKSSVYSIKSNRYTVPEEKIDWYFETVSQGYTVLGCKYVSSLLIRMECDDDTIADISIQYDGVGTWHRQKTVCGKVGNVVVPIRPKRCDSFKIRMSGNGNIRIISITKTLEECSPYMKREI